MEKFRVTFDLWAESRDEALATVERMARSSQEHNYDTFTIHDDIGSVIESGGSWVGSGQSDDFAIGS